MENLIKMDDLGGNTPIFGNTQMMLSPRFTLPKVRPILPGFNVLEFRGRTRVPTSHNHTVDGKNHAPVDMVNIPLLTGFQHHVRW